MNRDNQWTAYCDPSAAPHPGPPAPQYQHQLQQHGCPPDMLLPSGLPQSSAVPGLPGVQTGGYHSLSQGAAAFSPESSRHSASSDYKYADSMPTLSPPLMSDTHNFMTAPQQSIIDIPPVSSPSTLFRSQVSREHFHSPWALHQPDPSLQAPSMQPPQLISFQPAQPSLSPVHPSFPSATSPQPIPLGGLSCDVHAHSQYHSGSPQVVPVQQQQQHRIVAQHEPYVANTQRVQASFMILPSDSHHHHHHQHQQQPQLQQQQQQQLQQQQQHVMILPQQSVHHTPSVSSISSPPPPPPELWATVNVQPNATTPSPFPYQYPMATGSSTMPHLASHSQHFCPIHSVVVTTQNLPSYTERRMARQTSLVLTKEEEEMERMRLSEFAQRFKVERDRFGYSASSVNQQLAIRYGTSFSFGKIEQFEMQTLPLSEMMTIKQVLEWWLLDTARAGGMSEERVQELAKAVSPPRRELRKRRTAIDEHTRKILEEEFIRNSKPTPAQLQEIGNKLGIEKEVVKIWFANQRQKVRKQREKSGGEGSSSADAGESGEAGSSAEPSSSQLGKTVPGLDFEPDIPSVDFIPLLDPMEDPSV